jgi:hypothetical protein
MESGLELPAVSKLMEKDFVICWIDVDRMKGGKDIELKMNGGKQGLPWFVFLDPDGKPLADSDDGGSNLGCPYTEAEVEAFRGLLLKAKQRLTEAEVGTIIDALHEAGDRGEKARKAREAEKAAAAQP